MNSPYRTAAEFMDGASRPGIFTRMWRAVFGRLVYAGPETCGHCRFWKPPRKVRREVECTKNWHDGHPCDKRSHPKWERPTEEDKGDCKLIFSHDGVESKDSEVLVVLTTNNVEGINQALLRPGRLDAIVSVRAPDQDAVKRLIRLYARGLVSEKENLGKVAKSMDGQIPAFIREVVERAKLSAINRLQPGEEMSITAQDLEVSAAGMLAHLKLLEEKKEDKRSDMEKAAGVIATAFHGNGSSLKPLFQTNPTE